MNRPRRTTARMGGIASAIGVMLLAGPAAAGNGTKPRITVDWTDAPCMTIVDRSADPVVHMTYSITQEDTDITTDEVSDSRTHQFFAFCHAHDPQSFLPNWITQDDVDRAAAVGAGPDMVDPEDKLETHPDWTGCFVRITPDDARLPITFAQAAMGVDWDTTGLPAGAYIIDGYTFEPAINVWRERPGVIKVVDDPALSASGPALAINNTEEVLNKNEPVTIEGCVSAMDGSTITAYWGFAEPDVQWQPFIEDDAVVGGSFAVELMPPEELAGESAMIRVDVTDPMGRSYTNYMRELVIVLGTDGPGSCNDGGGFIGNTDCSDSGDSGGSGDGTGGTGNADGTAGTGDGDATGNTTANQDGGGEDGGGKGCGCTTSTGSMGGSRALPALGLLFGLLGLRRRRWA